ncbi:MAG TPA: RNA 2',3'-cyclic phosphodiesterase [Egicoccus sp.]|nr:RNA 2',3'-cyclic phosphodiesterase [Egicoccus sp.]HSK22513.1 RNA 2',3'-cyclic phosphodiesterase [Egicoccus sp.]
MRLFVALPIPDALRTAAAEVVAPLRERGDGLRWPDPAGWHVTLAFLGEVAPERRGEAAVVLDGAVAGVAPMAMRSGAPDRFGRGVLWLGVDSEPPGLVADLGAAVQAALEAAGLPVERRPVQPHVTLARGGRRRVTDALLDDVEVAEVAWTADRIELWSSRLGNGPARYAVEHTAPLRG